MSILICARYYVSNECLSRAVHVTRRALRQLSTNDRVALYTTAGNDVLGMKSAPENLVPLRSVDQDTRLLFQNMVSRVTKNGTPTWTSPCLKISMQDTILDIVFSLRRSFVRSERCHMMLLSPRLNMFHELSGMFPSLRIHQINPAVIPFRRDEDCGQMNCLQECCRNMSNGNWINYQSVSGCIRERILRARAESSPGIITDIHASLRPNSGCEIVRIENNTNMESLQAGQVFSFLARVRVSPPHTLPIDPNLDDTLFQDSLDATNVRQELRVAEALGATLTDILTVQVFYKNSLNPAGTWSYTEAPLVVIKRLGKLPHPHGYAQDIYKRRIFHITRTFSNLTADKELRRLATEASFKEPELQQVVADALKELDWQRAVLKYEATARQELPLCADSVGMSQSLMPNKPATNSQITEIFPAKNLERL